MLRTRAALPCLIALSVPPLIAGCVMGPHYHRPSLPPATTSVPGVAAGAAESFSTARAISAQWWTLFRSPALNKLIERAFAANPTIDAAVAALKEAQENVYAQRGYFYPTVQVSYQAERTKLSGNTATSSAPG